MAGREINDKFLFFNKEEIELLREVMSTKKLSGTSEWVDKYEEKLSTYFGAKYAVALSSGSAALHTAFHIIGVTNGDEVLVPATAAIPSVLPILMSKGRPIFVDTEPDNLGFDCNDLKNKITRRTRAALAVPLWGYPTSYNSVLKVLNEADIPLVEDACQAHGTLIEGKKAGTWGSIGCFSTHDRKLVSTGEGGFLLTNDEDIFNAAKQFTQLGYMDGINYGMNYKISTLQAALGINRLNYLDSQIKIRADNARHILKEILNKNISELPITPNSYPNYYSLIIQIKSSPKNVIDFINFLTRNGIPSDIVKYGYTTVYSHPLFGDANIQRCPNAENLVKRITSLPVHPGISKEDIEYMIEIIRQGQQIIEE